jgi:glycosyltransferase involved in cell wall biosynthesis
MRNLLRKEKGSARETSVCPEELDLTFYRHWYEDLAPLSDARLIRHWLKEGKAESRLPNFSALLEREKLDIEALPEDFAWEIYVRLNADLTLAGKAEYHAVVHFLTDGVKEGRHYRFDLAFYSSVYDGLSSLAHIEDAIDHWLEYGREQGFSPSLDDFLLLHGIEKNALPFELNYAQFVKLNPDSNFKNLYDAIVQMVRQAPVQKLRPHANNQVCADFYNQLGLHLERVGNPGRATDFYQLSLLFVDTPVAHEHLANLALTHNLHHQATLHYRAALECKSRSVWVPLNLARTYSSTNQFKEAVDVVIEAAGFHSDIDALGKMLREILLSYWASQEQAFQFLGAAGRRAELMDVAENATDFVATSYARLFSKFSPSKYRGSLNSKKVLIVGAFGLAQCYRYRIAQKERQLELEGYDVKVVNYLDGDDACDSINFFDLIILYRVPANPDTIRMIEYARSSGKILYYDIDDLLVDPCNPPPIESYGGQVSPAVYVNLVKDTAMFRAATRLCDFAISSTKPLLEKLSALVRTRQGFLHRNALDEHILPRRKDARSKPYISIFYGSGTLAHNSDFTDIALPAIDRILSTHKNVRFVAVGHLKLPATFLQKHPEQVVQLPIMQNPQVYLNCLSSADINIAVLHSDVINDCKSEIKWMEAAYFGIPSVMSTTKNYLDVVRDGSDGYLANNEDDWFEYLERLVLDESLRLKLGAAARARVTDEYMPATLGENLRNLLDSSIAHRESHQ